MSYDSLARLAAELVEEGVPQGIVDHHIDSLTQALVRALRHKRALGLLGLQRHVTVAEAAKLERCHPVTLYRRAAKSCVSAK